jgi:predicted TIM-barrel fold metal-dependent hydrolase
LYIAESAEKYPDTIIPAGWTDPRALEMKNAKRMVYECIRKFGMSVVKMNPAQNTFPIDSPEVLEIVELIVGLGAVPAFHFGADTPYTPAAGLREIAKRIHPHPLIAVHMGGGGAAYTEAESLYQDARILGMEYTNIKYILSAKRDAHIESDILRYLEKGDSFTDNLCFGSDAPYGKMAWNLGGMQAMFKNLQNAEYLASIGADPVNTEKIETVTMQILGDNFARIIIDSITTVLDKWELSPNQKDWE